MNSKNIVMSIVCVMASLAGLWLLQSDKKSQEEVLRLGTMSGWPPYVFIDADGTYKGFDIAIAQRIAQSLQKKLVISDMDTAALLTALEQGKVDFIMTGLSITQERQQKIEMIPYQGKPIVSYPLVFYKVIPQGIQSWKDLLAYPGAVISVEPGSSQASFLKSYEKYIHINQVDPSLGLLELVSGKITGLLLEDGLLSQFKKRYPDLVSLAVPLDKEHQVLGNGIGVNKNNKELIKAIQKTIDQLKEDGSLASLESLWFEQEN